VDPGASQVIRVVVSVTRAAGSGAVKDSLVTATSLAMPPRATPSTRA
jgi:hypothetical protein